MSSVTRKCPKCNWEFPGCFTKTKCRFCGTFFETQWCLKCQQFKPIENFYWYKTGKNAGYLTRVCKTCNAEIKKEWDELFPEQKRIRANRFVANKLQQINTKYEEWLDLSKIDFKPMTEDEWLATCAYFDGCAICGCEHIEAREFFVPFAQGGKYASWNMFPMCGKCAGAVQKYKNPFRWLDKNLGTAKELGLTEERKKRLLEYFILQIERNGGNEG
jgi:hypothetical protein